MNDIGKLIYQPPADTQMVDAAITAQKIWEALNSYSCIEEGEYTIPLYVTHLGHTFILNTRYGAADLMDKFYKEVYRVQSS